MSNKFLTVPEVADQFSITTKTVYRLAKNGEIPVIKIGRAVRFDPRQLEEWLSRQSRTSHIRGE